MFYLLIEDISHQDQTPVIAALAALLGVAVIAIVALVVCLLRIKNKQHTQKPDASHTSYTAHPTPGDIQADTSNYLQLQVKEICWYCCRT